jgi:hypothetical protein
MRYSHGIPLAITLLLLTISCALTLSYKVRESVTHDEHPDEEGKTVYAFGMCDTDDILASKRIG